MPQNDYLILQYMWDQLCSLPVDKRTAIAEKLIEGRKLESMESFDITCAYHDAYEIVHGED